MKKQALIVSTGILGLSISFYSLAETSVQGSAGVSVETSASVNGNGNSAAASAGSAASGSLDSSIKAAIRKKAEAALAAAKAEKGAAISKAGAGYDRAVQAKSAAASQAETNAAASVDAQVEVKAGVKRGVSARAAAAAEVSVEKQSEMDARGTSAKEHARFVVEAKVAEAAQHRGRASANAKLVGTMSAEHQAKARVQAKAEIASLMADAKLGKEKVGGAMSTYDGLVAQGLSHGEAMLLVETYVDAGANAEAEAAISANLGALVGVAANGHDLDLKFTHNHISVDDLRGEIAESFSMMHGVDVHESIESIRDAVSLSGLRDAAGGIDIDINRTVGADLVSEIGGSVGSAIDASVSADVNGSVNIDSADSIGSMTIDQGIESSGNAVIDLGL